MRLASEWKLTFDPGGSQSRVLIDYGQDISGELLPQLAKLCDPRKIVDSDPFLRDAKSRLYTLNASVYTYGSLDKNSRSDALDSLVAVESLTRNPLRLQVRALTDRYWQWANSFVTLFAPVMDVDADQPCFIQNLSVVATKFTRTNI